MAAVYWPWLTAHFAHSPQCRQMAQMISDPRKVNEKEVVDVRHKLKPTTTNRSTSPSVKGAAAVTSSREGSPAPISKPKPSQMSPQPAAAQAACSSNVVVQKTAPNPAATERPETTNKTEKDSSTKTKSKSPSRAASAAQAAGVGKEKEQSAGNAGDATKPKVTPKSPPCKVGFGAALNAEFTKKTEKKQ